MTARLLFALVAASGLFLSSTAPAQLHVHARLGRHFSVGADVGGLLHGHRHRHHHYDHGHHQHGGHWQTITERVWVPGCTRTIHHPAVYGWITDNCGRRRWGIVAPARCETIQEPGRWECRERRVWVRC
jgi:hypothetical protein